MKVSKPVLFTLIGAITIIIYLFFFAGPKKPPSVDVQLPQKAEVKMQPALKEIDRPKDEPKRITHVDAYWKNDPFILPKVSIGEEEVFHEPLKLSGIIEGNDGRYAIIGTNIVKKGDFIGDEKVLDIGKDSVIIARRGKKKTISISDLSREMGFKPSSPEGKR
ncbi:MAG TPA: hypothetical protein PK800_06195 [Syntrophorhabdaceae bacterium]|nr:hypothetical protein [Syntrophorhabdaceae bacterium]